jgi:hypothetical protein
MKLFLLTAAAVLAAAPVAAMPHHAKNIHNVQIHRAQIHYAQQNFRGHTSFHSSHQVRFTPEAQAHRNQGFTHSMKCRPRVGTMGQQCTTSIGYIK